MTVGDPGFADTAERRWLLDELYRRINRIPSPDDLPTAALEALVALLDLYAPDAPMPVG